MKEFCHSTNIPLAPNCLSADKAFEMKSRGIVLGVGFDSRDLTCFLAPAKAEKVIHTTQVLEDNQEQPCEFGADAAANGLYQ